jgi:hypothetical protein
MSSYETQKTGLSRAEWTVVIATVIVGALVASCFGAPVTAQAGGAPPDPTEGTTYRYQIDGAPPEWIAVMQEAISLRRTALDEFVAAGESAALAAIASAQTDAELATAHLQLRGFRLIAVELADIPMRGDILAEDVGRLILQRIEVGAFGVFSDAERAALAQAAFDFCRGVIAEEAAIRAARWNTMASREIAIPSDLGSPILVE